MIMKEFRHENNLMLGYTLMLSLQEMEKNIYYIKAYM